MTEVAIERYKMAQFYCGIIYVTNFENKTILITGVAGFIGAYLSKRVCEENPSAKIIGFDEAHKELVPMQPGDVPITYADTTALYEDFGFKPSTPLREGLRKFAEWYKEYYR